ncbi:hypothetical protein Nepgr_021149 [Nepenthes gracilis]|uniref:Uncharacterized protein n=1 Tax=Nepenthes gracilis TaxID=150966 RepID=A0AAD3SWD2_NEPGR|nr:hypothetical protein Nepgr_021149 [Nepenthes gracilis]
MKLAVRDDKESYPYLSDFSFSRIGDISKLHQPPSVNTDLLQSASYAASAPKAIAHSDNMASCNGSHNFLMKVVPISSSNTQSVACSFLSSMETSSSTRMPLSDEIPTTTVMGTVAIDAGPPQDASNTAEEVVDDEDDFHDPTLNALKKSLEANTTETYLDSLNLEGWQTVHDFIE